MNRLVLGFAFPFVALGFVALGAWHLVAEDSGSPGSAVRAGDAAVRWVGLPLEVAAGDGYQGPWRMNDSDFRYVDGTTTVVEDDGSLWVAWVDQARKDVLFQRFDADGEALLDEPVNVSRSPAVFSWLPRLVRGEPDSSDVFLLWQDIVFHSGSSHGGDIFFSRSTDGGRTWSAPLDLSDTPAGAGKGRLTPEIWDNGSLDLVHAPGGVVIAAWTEYEGALRVSRSTDRGETFSDPVTVVGPGGRPGEGGQAGAPTPARGPSLAAGPDGLVHLAWTVGDDPGADIHLARSDDGGRTFSAPRVVHPGSGHADAPALALSPDGTLHLVYGESEEGPLRNSAVRYARLLPGADGFEELRTLAMPRAARGESAGFPSIGLDGSGNPVVLWELFPDPRDRPVGLALVRSGDGGSTFEPSSVVPGTHDPALGFNGSLQGLLSRKLWVSEGGMVAVANSTFLPSERSRAVVHRGRIDGG